jgi:hypothetical protein
MTAGRSHSGVLWVRGELPCSNGFPCTAGFCATAIRLPANTSVVAVSSRLHKRILRKDFPLSVLI